ncbi:hypothetical protein PVAND_016588 [Polypedilum vanderplanki]|uniref:Uncharacterized protein n=1 Tax=Polypedilum vanderplanki TaxID=319348 RepID=A0A9J6BGR0_POLVA|nr:hypothetical protein PVAND_016588 [Polypedilum vanderplanki]
MEILAVQNEFMHVMPSKTKDGSNTLRWTTSNTKSATKTSPKHHHHHQKVIKEDLSPAVPAIDDDDDSFLHQLPHWNESEIEHVRNVLMATLRDAKQRHLACTEVLLPCDMLQRIAVDMLMASDEEACGIRGANIRIEFEESDGECREIATCNTDLNTVATFELRLTLKQEHGRSKWISAIMPQFIRNLTRGSTIVISRDYELVKHKLNYSFAE